MRPAPFAIFFGFLLSSAVPALAQGLVGFQELQMPDAEDDTLTVGVWYPTKAAETVSSLEGFRQSVALGAPVAGKGLPLVVLSHGGGGSFASHYDTALALAQAGFVAAAVNHKGDTYDDQSKVLELWRRPRQLHRLISFMLQEWSGHSLLDPRRVGAFGFSNGGFTVLVAIGGVPDLAKIGPYCFAEPRHDLCTALRSAGVDLRGVGTSVPPNAWVEDPRIHAAVIAAPAFAFSFKKESLARIRIPIQLWRAANDRHQPNPYYEEFVRKALPIPPEYHVVSGAGHYDFLPPCTTGMTIRLPAICKDPAGFDRKQFHQDFNQQVVRFFRSHLVAEY